MSEPNVPDRTDTPAVALGPTALFLGVWAPALAFVMFPMAIIAGGLAATLGAAGIHYACHGTGHLWTAIAGTALGILGLACALTFMGVLSG
ncbi:hypothetical protein AB0D04_04205 [Streptomyces sp. NPDC048483]|uniref:hypothetical protein n=1 Tax=Streptomyces sp. NPDC048483 TaxID=3154927 RepID=UPI00344150BE